MKFFHSACEKKQTFSSVETVWLSLVDKIRRKFNVYPQKCLFSRSIFDSFYFDFQQNFYIIQKHMIRATISETIII